MMPPERLSSSVSGCSTASALLAAGGQPAGSFFGPGRKFPMGGGGRDGMDRRKAAEQRKGWGEGGDQHPGRVCCASAERRLCSAVSELVCRRESALGPDRATGS